MRRGNGGDVFEVVGVFAVVVGDLLAVGPHAHGRAGGVAVALELFLAILELRFFQLDQDVGDGGIVPVEDADVGALFFAAKGDLVLDRHAVEGVAEVIAQDHQIELAHRLLGVSLIGLPRTRQVT